MPKSKNPEKIVHLQTTVSDELADWLHTEVEDGRAYNISEAVRFAIKDGKKFRELLRNQ